MLLLDKSCKFRKLLNVKIVCDIQNERKDIMSGIVLTEVLQRIKTAKY